jgi:hypothetical protein
MRPQAGVGVQEDAQIADGFRRRHEITANSSDSDGQLMLPTTGAAPHDLSLRRIQLKAAAAQATGNVINEGRQLELQQSDRRRLD